MKKDALKGMEMPAKKKDPMLEMDDELLMEDEAYDLGEGLDEEMGEGGMLDEIADEELIAEMKKRGLSLDEEPLEEGEDELSEDEFEGELA